MRGERLTSFQYSWAGAATIIWSLLLQRRGERKEVQPHQQRRPERHLHGARAADQLQRLVDDQRHHEDVDDVPPGHGRAAEPREDGVHERGDAPRVSVGPSRLRR